jgi:hypothetical protein
LGTGSSKSLEFQFETKVLRLQPVGMLVFCLLGDRIPIRLGMPANRPGKLYAYSRNQWEPACNFPMQQWHSLKLTVRSMEFSIVVDNQPPKTFSNPLVNPTPRLYFGDSFEVDYIYSNSGSEFLVDLASIRSQVK